MPIKWSKAEAIRHLHELKSPFETQNRKLLSPDLVLKAIKDRGNGGKGLPIPTER